MKMQITMVSFSIFVPMIFQFIADFLQHKITAKSRHGTHSPFVYKLTDEVIYDFSSKKEYKDVEEQRKKLLNDERIISVTCLGAASNLDKHNIKQVKKIARNIKKPRIAQLIYRLVKVHQPRNIIELGTCLGITTAYLAAAQPEAEVVTMECCPEIAAIARENFRQLQLNKVELQVGNFNELLPKVIAETEALDFVFINGRHTKEATLDYFTWCLPKLTENSLLIFDEIYGSKGMKEAWTEIKKHPQVRVTIDLFWIGLVYFKKGQAKEHFKIKF
jgi:predicted O-methyltransferase YrrM